MKPSKRKKLEAKGWVVGSIKEFFGSAKMKKKTKKAPIDKWTYMPQQEWKDWFGQYLISRIALEYYHTHKRFPIAFDSSSAVLKDQKDGSAKLTLQVW